MLFSLRRIAAMARLIVRDGIKRHALIGLVLFALAGITGGLLFVDFIPKDIGRASCDFLFSVIWVSGFIFLLFHGVQVAAWDAGRGSIHTFLARPISRTEYALALYLGLALLLLALNVILGALSWGVLQVIKNSVQSVYFPHLLMKNFWLSWLGMYTIQLILLSVILLFSSAIRGSLPVLLLTLCYYFICTGLPVVRDAFTRKLEATEGKVLIPLLKWLAAFFPDFSWLDFKGSVVDPGHLVPVAQTLSSFSLAGFYIAIVLWLTSFIYTRRDLQ